MAKKQKKPTTSNTRRLQLQNTLAKMGAVAVQFNLAERKMGRAPKYHPAFVYLAECACIINADNPGLADMLGASPTAVQRWINEFPDFGAAIKRGKARTDEEIEKALVHRAKGYSHRSVKFFMYEGEVIKSEFIEQYPPDTSAIQFWLKNRRPDRYRGDQSENIEDPDAAARAVRERLAAIEAQSAKPPTKEDDNP